eukprot:361363-Chlamydomonas_euryale.AAC.1
MPPAGVCKATTTTSTTTTHTHTHTCGSAPPPRAAASSGVTSLLTNSLLSRAISCFCVVGTRMELKPQFFQLFCSAASLSMSVSWPASLTKMFCACRSHWLVRRSNMAPRTTCHMGG